MQTLRQRQRSEDGRFAFVQSKSGVWAGVWSIERFAIRLLGALSLQR